MRARPTLTPPGTHKTTRSKLLSPDPLQTTTRGRASQLAAAVSQIVAHNLRDSGYTFYRESMLVLGYSRRHVQAHTCARTHKHPCTYTRTHADTHTPTSHKPKHAHTRAHAHKRAHTRPRILRWSALTSNASMEIDHPAVATWLVATMQRLRDISRSEKKRNLSPDTDTLNIHRTTRTAIYTCSRVRLPTRRSMSDFNARVTNLLNSQVQLLPFGYCTLGLLCAEICCSMRAL